MQHAGSVVAECGLSCSAARGILVPQPGIEPKSPTLEGGFFTTEPPGKSLMSLFNQLNIITNWEKKRKLVFPQGHDDRWVAGVLPEESTEKDTVLSPWDSQACWSQATPRGSY